MQGTERELPIPLNATSRHCRCSSSDLVLRHCCRLGRVHQRAASASAASGHLQQSVASRVTRHPEENKSRRPIAPAQPRLERRVLLSQVALLGLLSPVQMAGAQQVDPAEPVAAAKGLIEGALASRLSYQNHRHDTLV